MYQNTSIYLLARALIISTQHNKDGQIQCECNSMPIILHIIFYCMHFMCIKHPPVLESELGSFCLFVFCLIYIFTIHHRANECCFHGWHRKRCNHLAWAQIRSNLAYNLLFSIQSSKYFGHRYQNLLFFLFPSTFYLCFYIFFSLSI